MKVASVTALSSLGLLLVPSAAFVPSTKSSASKSSLAASPLSDQLSQIQYNGAFSSVGKFASSAASRAATATSTSTAASIPSPQTSDATAVANVDFAEIFANVARAFTSLEDRAVDVATATLTTIQAYESSLDLRLTSDPAFGEAWTSVKAAIAPLLASLPSHPDLGNVPPSVALILASYVTYSIVSTVLSFGDEPPPASPYPMNRYDPTSARRYFDGRWNLVVGRTIQVSLLSGAFLIGILADYLKDELKTNAERRAVELAELLTTLGPSFIKIGQSLSIRTDLLSPAYVRGLKKLQDQVPAFPTNEAREILERELGRSVEEFFEDFPTSPVAAASLGQVYKATVRKGILQPVRSIGEDGTVIESEPVREVAIKIQRPDIMNQIALDMHLIREAAPVLKRAFNLATDLAGTVDAWGAGFIDELDYVDEAANAKSFTLSIADTPLSGVVFAPEPVDELTTGRVLTTEWVVGERLDKSAKDDVTILCSIAMNAYLTMMLETGVLHCDPHPGNLLRTTDGKLCILDWGMVTRLEPDIQITLIEHMAHLTSADYNEIPRDLLLLGFIPENKADLIEDSGVVETLAEIYGAWTKGGGAASVNVNQVVADLQDLTAEKGNLFQIPPYFAYIAKSFSVLEGIGLSNDPKYSIINECLPYVSKRLLTDQSERTGGALSTFIFGPKKNDEDRIIDYDRVEQLVQGFGDYTTSASGELLGKNSTRTEVIEELSASVLDLLATEEPTPLQLIFIEQLAKIITSYSRSAWSDIRERSGVLPSGRTVLGTIVDPLGVFRTSPILRANDLDERTVETTRNLISLLQRQASEAPALDAATLSNAEVVEVTSIVTRKLWQRRGGVVKTGNRLAMELLRLTADRLESGEREALVAPVVGGAGNDGDDAEANDGRIREQRGGVTKAKDAASDRLATARDILARIE